MSDLDLNNLRSLLGDYERYARSITGIASRRAIAEKMLAAIAEAREGLKPSPDSTANYVEGKSIIERLARLRQEAESA